MEWGSSTRAAVSFARMMRLAGAFEFDDPDVVIDYFASPWVWTREHEVWDALGQPTPDSPSWLRFVALVGGGAAAMESFLSRQPPSER